MFAARKTKRSFQKNDPLLESHFFQKNSTRLRRRGEVAPAQYLNGLRTSSEGHSFFAFRFGSLRDRFVAFAHATSLNAL